MKSPFAGMDPYIEACGLWESFYSSLIAQIAGQLADNVPERYIVRTKQRSYLVLADSEEKLICRFVPDFRVIAKPAFAETPHVLRAFLEEEHNETFVEIYETKPEMRLVTIVEVLSPSNKRPGTPGWDLYLRKRQSILLDRVNLVELDLLRGGQRMPMLDPWPKCPYTLMVARAMKPHACRVWEGHFQRPLPTIPIPLAKPDPDILLNLQPLIDTIYQRFRYSQSIDYATELTPPLSADESAANVER